MTEIQGKSILVRVSARFELARVRVIGSRLYKKAKKTKTSNKVWQKKPVSLFFFFYFMNLNFFIIFLKTLLD